MASALSSMRLCAGRLEQDWHRYYTRENALQSKKYLDGMKLDERYIRIDLDPGFLEGRQFGRGRRGGQVLLSLQSPRLTRCRCATSCGKATMPVVAAGVVWRARWWMVSAGQRRAW